MRSFPLLPPHPSLSFSVNLPLREHNPLPFPLPAVVQLKTEVPGKSGVFHLAMFDHDDGQWILDMTRKKREMAQGVAVIAATALWHLLLLLLTCGATETDLTFGNERYPLFAAKYGYKGIGKYKHFMKINADDHYQIDGEDEDRPPDNYTYAKGVKYLPGGKVAIAKANKANKNKINPEEAGTTDIPRPKDHDLADPHIVGGMRGNGYKHGRKRPQQALAFFEEVRIIVYVNEEVLERGKSGMWISNDLIVKNKKEHKKDKERALKMAQEKESSALAAVHEGGEEGEGGEVGQGGEGGGGKEKKTKKKAKKVQKLSMEERVRQANIQHSKQLREQPLKRRHTIKSVKRDVSNRYDSKREGKEGGEAE